MGNGYSKLQHRFKTLIRLLERVGHLIESVAQFAYFVITFKVYFIVEVAAAYFTGRHYKAVYGKGDAPCQIIRKPHQAYENNKYYRYHVTDDNTAFLSRIDGNIIYHGIVFN